MPNSQRQHDDIGGFMNMITSSPTVDAVPVSVIEDIKSEIRQRQWYLDVNTANQVIYIIDKHISGVKMQGGDNE